MAGNGKKLRSEGWFGGRDMHGFIHRSWMKNQGFAAENFEGRPVIGIANSASEVTPCNAHLGKVAEAVKRGVWKAGGFPLEFPTMSLGEPVMRPTTMLFRNLMSMDVEESLRANPFDAVVLLCGCDKTTPAQIMGASSVDLPTIVVTGGPMLNGKFQGKDIGSGTDVWRFTDDLRAGRMSIEDYMDAEACLSRSAGHCMTMGTASTMASISEALGLQPPGGAAIPAVDSRRYALAEYAGGRAVEMVAEDLRISKILTRDAFENAIRVNAAIGGSTNAIVHLLAIAGRLGVQLRLDDFDELIRDVPFLVNLQPSGEYLMEDFYYAGGLPVVMKELGSILHEEALTMTGNSVAENVRKATNHNEDVIKTRAKPISDESGTVILRGNLCPDGAVLKQSAATPELMQHRGRAVVFEDIDDLNARLDLPETDIDETCVMVLKNAGPRGYPGMPELGNLPLPKRVLEKGIEDMVRISDARMSGTCFGTIVLHVAPESAIGGPLGLVKDGDMIELDVEGRRLHLDVSDEELAARRAAWTAPEPPADRGYAKLYVDHVLQADEGVDFDFLRGSSGSAVPRQSH
ncbi:MAG: IlvD/Edd family dehydratase [Alphaproteobacteria bacterium]|nr:IlvD/Edd family dehydratase [Alphaproteobacteria bacterium]